MQQPRLYRSLPGLRKPKSVMDQMKTELAILFGAMMLV
jgi:hypothetical protein